MIASCPQNQKEFLGQSQIANWLKYKISKYLHRQIEIFLQISIFYLTEILHGENKVTAADLIPCYLSDPMLAEWVSVRGRRFGERESWTKLYLFSFSDHIWSLSRADAWIAAVETDVWPPWGNFIEKFQNNTASTLPFVFASKHFVVYILSAKTRI